MKKKGFFGYRQYVIAGLLIALAAVGTTAIYSSRQEKEREQMEAELAEEMQKQADDIAAEENSEQSAEASALVPPKQSLNEMENELDDPAVRRNLQKKIMQRKRKKQKQHRAFRRQAKHRHFIFRRSCSGRWRET